VDSNAGPSGKTGVETNLGGQADNAPAGFTLPVHPTWWPTTVTITNCPHCGWPVRSDEMKHVCRDPAIFINLGEQWDADRSEGS
jgi:hypothetical protein